MSIKHLIWQGLKKNLQNYYLYVFALVFSVALYFSFVTLQYEPALESSISSAKGSAAFYAGSVLLIAIVAVFLLYANTLFTKRRSKEIGLFQLIGMTKGRIFRILSLENLILYIGSVIIGIFLGFAVSKLMKMVFFKITGIHQFAALAFSASAIVQTLMVFFLIYLFIMLMNYLFIKRQSVLSLFNERAKKESTGKELSIIQVLMGILGIGLIGLGYYLSTILFNLDNIVTGFIFLLMISILGCVIIGTYLFFKGSVAFILQLIRRSKMGYLKIHDVLSLSSIMFRMKSNAMLLTIITTVSALAIGLMSLMYISYYSTEKLAQELVPNDFSVPDQEAADYFNEALVQDQIHSSSHRIDFMTAHVDLKDAIKPVSDDSFMNPADSEMPIISDKSIEHMNVASDEAVLAVSSSSPKIFSFYDEGDISLSNTEDAFNLSFTEVVNEAILPNLFVMSAPAIAIVDDSIYQQLDRHKDPAIQNEFGSTYIGIDISDKDQLQEAESVFKEIKFDERENPVYNSQLAAAALEKRGSGISMFIVGFLGLTFLITSGCILYFKQMDESEEEKDTYTILQKLGFAQGDLIQGIWYKQLFNFGIPLLLGLLHSYFAVKSGWFLFGMEMVVPMIIVMGIYTILYSAFAVLSVLYYKQVIQEAL